MCPLEYYGRPQNLLLLKSKARGHQGLSEGREQFSLRLLELARASDNALAGLCEIRRTCMPLKVGRLHDTMPDSGWGPASGKMGC